jgi:hypothetical protein
MGSIPARSELYPKQKRFVLGTAGFLLSCLPFLFYFGTRPPLFKFPLGIKHLKISFIIRISNYPIVHNYLRILLYIASANSTLDSKVPHGPLKKQR